MPVTRTLCLLLSLLGLVLAVSADARAGAPRQLQYRDSRGEIRTLRARIPDEDTLFRKGAARLSRRGLQFETRGARAVLLERDLILRFRAPLRSFPTRFSRDYGLTPRYPLDAAGRTWLAAADDAEHALALTFTLAEDEALEWVAPDFQVPFALTSRPNDPWYPEQWFHAQENGQHLHSEGAWAITMGRPEIVVAVIDTGLDMQHPDFAPERLVTGWNAGTREEDPTPGPKALDAHGTQAAGVIAATGNNRVGVIGVCPNCSLMGVRFLDAFTDETELSRAFSAVQWAVGRGADVLSCSFEVGPLYIDLVDMRPLYTAVQDAVTEGRGGRGTVVVVAAGNSRAEIDSRALAHMPEVITVGAVDWMGRWLDYSNTGENLSVVAPSGPYDLREPQIFTTDVSGPGGVSRDGWLYRSSRLVDYIRTDHAQPDPTGDYTAYFNGTSAAVPMVAGVAALMLSVNPALRPADVRRLLEESADPLPLFDALPLPATHVGQGRVNAARAVLAAQLGLDGEPGVLCVVTANCRTGVCDEASGVCVVDCATVADCPASYECTGGRCVVAPVHPDPRPDVVGGDDVSVPPGVDAGVGAGDAASDAVPLDTATGTESSEPGFTVPGGPVAEPAIAPRGDGCAPGPTGRTAPLPWLLLLALVVLLRALTPFEHRP